MAIPTPTSTLDDPPHSSLHISQYDVRAMFGAAGDGSTDDSGAIQDAIDAAFTDGAAVYFPPATGYKVNSTIDLTGKPGVHLLGSTATAGALASFATAPQVKIIGATGLNPVFKMDGAPHDSNNITFENLAVIGGVCSVRIRDGALYAFRNCSFHVDSDASADNTPILLENVFWAWFDNCSFIASSVSKYATILRGKAPVLDVNGCSLMRWRNCRFNLNGLAVEAATPSGIIIGFLSFENCETENLNNGAFMTVINNAGGTWNSEIADLSFVRVAHHDAAGTCPYIRLNNIGTGVQLNRVVFEHAKRQTDRLIEVVGTGPNISEVISIGNRSQEVVTSAGAPYGSLYGFIRTKDNGLDLLSSDLGAPNETVRTGASGPAIRLGRSSEAHFAAGIAADGKHYWGPGGASGTWDTNLYRNAADQLKTDDKFLAAAGIGVGNSAAASGPVGSVVAKIQVFDASGASLGYVPVYNAIT